MLSAKALRIHPALDDEQVSRLYRRVQSYVVARPAPGIARAGQQIMHDIRLVVIDSHVLERHVDDLRARTQADNAALEAEIQKHVEDLRARIAENSRQLDSDVAELAAWRTRKHQEEAIIADAVSHFVSENPITTTPTPATPSVQGDPDDR